MRRALLLAALATVAPAQVRLNPPSPESDTIRVDVELVNVFCSVRDRSGAFIRDLAKDEFEVRDQGKIQPLTHFSRSVDSPITIALLLDVSGSVASVLHDEKSAAAAFFRDRMRPADRAMLVSFASFVTIVQDLTPNTGLLAAALDRAAAPLPAESARIQARGGTLLYDAVNLASLNKLRPRSGRKVIILISDGMDIGSVKSLDDAVKAAHQAEAVLYAIHFEDASSAASGLRPLRRLSEPTGGRTFEVGSGRISLAEAFSRIHEDMRSQYAIGFRPPPAQRGGEYRKLEIRVTRPGAAVSARKGYYSPQR